MRRWMIIALGVMAAFLLIAGCSARKEKTGDSVEAYHKIDAETAKEMMDAGGVTIVDVRTKEEYEEGHVPGAILIPNEEIDKEEPEALSDKEAVILVYCRSGRRSKAASDKLVEMGYQNIYDFGGIIDWTYETVTGEKE